MVAQKSRKNASRLFFILISPVFGRIGCGWFCFVGNVQDLNFGNSVFRIKIKKLILPLRSVPLLAFFVSAVSFFFINMHSGNIMNISFSPWFFDTSLNAHYQHVWLYDTLGALLASLVLEKRWVCRNLCAMGSLCAIGASASRQLPVIDTSKCNSCGRCESVCLVDIPLTDYIISKGGLVASSECLLCGRCVDACSRNAVSIRFVWNRKKYIEKIRSHRK